MHFAFDDDQVGLRDAVRDLLAKHATPDVVRAAWDAPPGALDRDVWDRLVAMGVPATLVAEADGGLGLDERSLVLVLEEAGRAALPHPLVETAAVAAPLLGAALVTERPDALVASDLGGPHVPCAADADLLLLVDRSVPGGALHLVEPPAVALTPAEAVDGARRLATVAWTPSPATLLTDDPADVALALDRGTAATAAVLVGLGQAMLDLTVTHVTQRHQFGVPVGSFQAVKHHLADALKELSFARVAAQRAAWSIAVAAPSRARDVSMAKAMASDAATLVSRAALQCHGAIGYTTEHDLHLFMKRTWSLSRTWGTATHHRHRVATLLGV